MTIKEIVQRLKTAMDDARGQESHFESWLTQNEGICDAIDALKELDKTEQEPCGGCGGSGWVTRDPDIGTDQECFVCGGSGAQPKEPEQEPVAKVKRNSSGQIYIEWRDGEGAIAHLIGSEFYTTPPQRNPLSYEDLIECEQLAGIRHRVHMGSIRGQQLSPADEFLWHYARAIEAAHGIKENT